MANKVLSIEIGNRITHVIETDLKAKNPKIYKSFSFETPEGIFQDDKLRDSGVFRDRLQEGMNECRIKTKRVLFILSSSRIANRDVVIPQVKENRILTLLHANSSEYFPVDLQQYQLVYRILGEVQEEGEKKYKLMVLAVPHEMIAAYRKLAAECGLMLEGLDYVGNAATQVLKGKIPYKVYAAVKIEDDSTLVTIVQDGSIRLQRNFSYGIEDAVSVIQRNERFEKDTDFGKALEILRKESFCINNSTFLDGSRELADDLEDSFRAIVGNISRVINFYSSNNAGVEMDSVILYGMGAGVQDLEKVLGEELTAPVTSDPLRKVIFREKSDLNKNFYPLSYAACIGAVIDPMDFRLAEEGKKKKKEKQQKEKAGIKKMQMTLTASGFFKLCLAAAVILLLAVVPYYAYLKININRMEEERKSKQNLSELYSKCEKVQKEYEDISSLYAGTEVPSAEIGAFIEEMEKKMPSDIYVRSLTSDSEGVIIDFNVKTKREAVKVIDEMEAFESIKNVEVQSLEEIKDELNNTIVNCIISCFYVNGTANENANETTVEQDVESLSGGAQQEQPASDAGSAQ